MRVRHDIDIKPCPPRLVERIVKEWGLEPEILDPAYRHIIAHDGKEILGLVTVFGLHPVKPIAHIVEHMRYKPGLSARCKLEIAYSAIDKISQLTQLMGYSRRHDRKFFDKLRREGIIRRIGLQSSGFETFVDAWETRKPSETNSNTTPKQAKSPGKRRRTHASKKAKGPVESKMARATVR